MQSTCCFTVLDPSDGHHKAHPTPHFLKLSYFRGRYAVASIILLRAFLIKTFIRPAKGTRVNMTPLVPALSDFFGKHMIDMGTVEVFLVTKNQSVVLRLLGLLSRNKWYYYVNSQQIILANDHALRNLHGDTSKEVWAHTMEYMFTEVSKVIECRQKGFFVRLAKSIEVNSLFVGNQISSGFASAAGGERHLGSCPTPYVKDGELVFLPGSKEAIAEAAQI